MGDVVYAVTGMTCGHCADAVTRALTAVEGIDAVRVDVAAGTVTVSEQTPVGIEQIRAAIDEAGYELADA